MEHTLSEARWVWWDSAICEVAVHVAILRRLRSQCSLVNSVGVVGVWRVQPYLLYITELVRPYQASRSDASAEGTSWPELPADSCHPNSQVDGLVEAQADLNSRAIHGTLQCLLSRTDAGGVGRCP